MTDYRIAVRRQLELEDEGRALGARRYKSRELPWKPEAGSPDEEANLPPGRALLKECVIPTANAIREFLEVIGQQKAGRHHNAYPLLLLSDPEEAAYLTARVLINDTIGGLSLQNIAIHVANAIIENLEFNALREINRKGYKGFMKKQEQRGYSRQRGNAVKKLFANEKVEIVMSKAERVTVGTKCIEMLVEATGFFVVERVRRAKGHLIIVRPSETLQDWLDKQHARCELLEPINMPMVVRPRRWRSPTYGGYLTPRPGNRFVKQRNKAYHDELRHTQIDKVYASINHIQDTPWSINTRILDVMEQVWTGGGSLGGLPQREDNPLPAKPFDIDTNEDAKVSWKKDAAAIYAGNAELVSARMALHQGLWVARRFAGEDRVFFPHELDFRGRVYPIPVFGPSPQGCDWQKSLIHFADGVALGEEGRRWLMIHIANLFGVDKVPFEDRIEWTLTHAAQICDSADNPLDGARFWTTADSPWSALAACFEFAGMLEQGVNYVSRLPVALDGSCSGLQHFSAMLRDEDGGRAVNLLPAETPQDVYMAVARNAQDMADCSVEALARLYPAIASVKLRTKVDGEEVELDTEVFRKAWAGGKISRAIAKRPTMTFCYSATRFGMQGMILGTLREMDRDREANGEPPYLGGVDNYQAAMWLSHVLYSSVSLTVSAAAKAMDWLRDVAKIAAGEDLPLWWTTPMGLPILQEYKKTEGVAVRAHWAGQKVDLTIHKEGETLDSRAQANGVAPNFVHSLDASHLQAVALRAKEEGIQHLAMIHDSFGTHAAHTGQLSRILRETFVEQYQGDVLGDFYEELKAQLGDELAEKLPRPPQAGSLDLNEVLAADYTFA